MFGLLVIFGQIRGEPWYGKNAGLMEGLPTGLTPRPVDLVPLSVCTRADSGTDAPAVPRSTCVDEPQRACRRHDQTQRVGAHDALPLATLVLPQTIEGVGVTDGNFHGPAVAILASRCPAALKVRSVVKKASMAGGGFLWPGRLVAAFGITPQHHDPHEAPGQHRVPQPIPGLDLGARFAGVR